MSNIQLNFNGFSSRVFIDGEKVSATDISLSATENLIQFSGAFGGSMNYSGDHFRLNTPCFYELPEISCSIGTEITFPQINNLFFDWLDNRSKERKVEISSGEKNNKTFYFPKCYFKSLKLGASQNSLVTANYDFYVLARELFNEPIKNDVPQLQNHKNNDFVFDMNSEDKDNKTPIGFWETEITGFGEDKKVLDWSLNISQNVVPKYYCGRNSDNEVKEPPLPDIMIGYPKMELTVSFLMDEEEFDKKVFAKFELNEKKDYPKSNDKEISSTNELSLKIRGKTFCKMLYGAVNSYSPSILTNGAITFNSNYLIHQIHI